MTTNVPNLYACISQYLRPPAEIDPHVAAHITWLGEQDAAGRLVASGRQLTRPAARSFWRVRAARRCRHCSPPTRSPSTAALPTGFLSSSLTRTPFGAV